MEEQDRLPQTSPVVSAQPDPSVLPSPVSHKKWIVIVGGLCIVLFIVSVGYFLARQEKNDTEVVVHITQSPTNMPLPSFTPTPTPMALNEDENLYTNALLGYSFIYPTKYAIHDFATFYSKYDSQDKGFVKVVDTTIDKNTGGYALSFFFEPTQYTELIRSDVSKMEGEKVDTRTMSFKEYTEKFLTSSCFSSGHGVTIYCKKITQIEPFTTRGGVDGYKVFLEVVITGKRDESYTKGPIYLFDISKRNNADIRGLQISQGSGSITEKIMTTEETNTLLETIVKTIMF